MNENKNLIVGQLRSIVENEKVFIGPEFLSCYARVVFGKKLDPLATKSATLLSKEIKSFISKLTSTQKESCVNIFHNLSQTEQKILNYIGKSFSLNNKVIDGDIALEKFKSLLDKDPSFESVDKNNLPYIKQEELTEETVSAIQNSFSEKKRMFNALIQYESLRAFINDGYKSCVSWDEFVENLNDLLKKALLDIQTYEYDTVNSIDLSSVSVNDMKIKKTNSEKISTGYRVLDSVLSGGFQPQRIYMFAGISGGGKSLVLVNFAFRSKLFLDNKYATPEERKKHAILYLSLENSVTETRDRFICCTIGKSMAQIDQSIEHNDQSNFNETYKKVFSEDSTSIYIVYRPAKSINVYDIQSIITDIERTSGRKIDICYVDYADKMSAANGSKSDQEWRDLGYITDELKSLSIGLNIPIVTVTQVSREAYKKDSNNQYSSPTGGNISGSIRKRENVDFLAIFNFKAKEEKFIDYSQLDEDSVSNEAILNSELVAVDCTVDKNRMGPDNLKFNVYIDYPTYRMLNYPTEVLGTESVKSSNPLFEFDNSFEDLSF